MHIERVRFDEVFDVQPSHGSFSFRSEGRPHYGLNLPGRVVPRPGQTFAIALARRDDWSSVLGWRELGADKVVLAMPDWQYLLHELGNVYLFGPFFMAGGFLFGGVQGGIAASVVYLAATLYLSVRTVRENRAVERALRAA